MVHFWLKIARMFSTRTLPAFKMRGNIGNRLSRVVWLYCLPGSSRDCMIPAPCTFLRHCRALKRTIATPPFSPLETIKQLAVWPPAIWTPAVWPRVI